MCFNARSSQLNSRCLTVTITCYYGSIDEIRRKKLILNRRNGRICLLSSMSVFLVLDVMIIAIHRSSMIPGKFYILSVLRSVSGNFSIVAAAVRVLHFCNVNCDRLWVFSVFLILQNQNLSR